MSDEMGEEQRGKVRVLRETTFLAMTSLVSFGLGLVRTKMLAVMWGPAAVGAVGMMQASMGTATLFSGLGIDGVVPRELGRNAQEEARRESVLAAASLGAPILGSVGAALAFLVMLAASRELQLGGPGAVGLLALGVVASVWSMNVRAALSGLGAVKQSGVLAMIASLLAGFMVAALIFMRPEDWVVASSVVAVPVAQLLVGGWLLRGLLPRRSVSIRVAVASAWGLAKMSNLFALACIVVVASQLLVRWAVRREVDADSFGAFQASMALSAVAVGVLAASVNTTVLPRMSALSSAPEEMSALMRQQALAYVSLFAPVALALVAFPELVVRLLYSDRFLGAAEQLRWQMVGEVLRLPCWIMGSVLVAKSRARACLVLEVSSLVVSVLLVILGARAGGGWLLGVATSIAAIVYFALLSFIVSRDGVVWGRGWLLKGGALLVFFVLGAVVSTWSVWGAGVVSCLALCGGGLALRRIFAGRE